MPSIAISPSFIPAWLPRISEACLVLLAAWLVAGWFATGGSGRLVPSASSPVAAVQPPDVAGIASFPLFGKQVVAPVPAAPVAAVPVQAAPLQLNLHLLGTVVAGDRSMAVVRAGSGEEQVVFLGGDIKPGVTLDEVDADAIVVNNRGRREKVLMAKGSLGRNTPPDFSAPGPQVIDANHRVFSRATINQQIRNMPKLLTGALAIPHQTNGNPDGFLIQDIVPGSLYAQAGLKNGDVIHSVNGQDISSPQQGMVLFQALQKASSLDLGITRAGKLRQLHYDIH